ncbi:uncharacterized protein [Littorina saxatilis]|uniref:AAA+ ATPase domain-containing protein n=1 Tax=Littorina saxatilis TaxID=31220 RepID=A0AAN9AT12_9CAEN
MNSTIGVILLLIQGRNASTMASPNSQTTSSNWRQIVSSLYPDAFSRTYCLPPVHFNKVPYVRDTVPGTGHSALVLRRPSGACPPVHNVPSVTQRSVPPIPHGLWSQESQPQAVPTRVSESDFTDDFAQNHVMLNLQELASSRHEVMFILSQFSFGDYLNQPAYSAAAAQLPRPSQLDTKQTKYSDGEVDFLLIHRQHGILIGELKSVGSSQAGVNKTQAQADADVAKRVQRAVKQLDRSETVVTHLVNDVAPGLTVRKTLFLPNVSTSQLLQVLCNNPQLNQAVCQSLGAANTTEAIQLCCCSDQLSDPASYWHVTPAVLSQLSTWWQHRMACTVDARLTDQLYLDIVARFVGPASTVAVHSYTKVRVEVRTAGQALAELGQRLALLVLTLQQVDLMNRDPPRVCITGPPGTGKTVLLVLQGIRWLLQGHDVQVVSTDYDSRAISGMIAEQLRLSLSADPTSSQTSGTVSFLQYDFDNREEDADQAITDLQKRVKNASLYVLLDEAFFSSERHATGLQHKTFVSRLIQRVVNLHLWVTCVHHTEVPPALQQEVFTFPLRSAPAVLREIQSAVGKSKIQVHEYSDSSVPAPGDGLGVIRLSHHGNSHTGRWPVDCVQCGQNIATELRSLGVGSSSTSNPAPLGYRDVFVLSRSWALQDDVTDDAGNVTSVASPVVLGLRAAGIPVLVLGNPEGARWEWNVHDVAVAASDHVTVAEYDYVSGMERRVVVMLQARTDEDDEDGLSDEEVDVMDRLYAVSRCTTQLIMVNVPPDTHDTATSATANLQVTT